MKKNWGLPCAAGGAKGPVFYGESDFSRSITWKRP